MPRETGSPEASAGDTSTAVDATPDAQLSDASPDAGKPITATEKVWTWIPFPQARCANNSPTGIGVNLNKQSKKVLIYIKGGGACWDHDTCNKVPVLSVDLDGYDQKKFSAIKWQSFGIFDRTSSGNLFADWSYVFVPYCTGDFHGGSQYSKVTGKHHVGHLNMARYLERLTATFSGASQVLLTGSSAGGFGTVMNYHQVQQAFGAIPVDLLDDSGPMLDEAYLKPKLQNAMSAAWGLSKSMPPGCAKCKTGYLDDLLGHLATAYPKRRFGLISSRQDAVIRTYFAHGYTPKKLIMPATDFKKGLDQLADSVLAPHSNWRVYYVPGVWHVFLNKTTLAVTSVSGTKLKDWIGDLVQGKPGWTNVRPKL